jgi:hypothetical protein
MRFADDTFIKVDLYTRIDAEKDPLILPLRNNGGFALPGGRTILTHELPCLSRAVDAGDPSFTPTNWPTKPGGSINKDQRGTGYTRIYDVPSITQSNPTGGAIDIGAFELGPQDLPPLAADFNGDGKVDAADLEIWKTNFGRTGVTNAQGDADADGKVDNEDLKAWADQFGQGPGVTIDADFNNDNVVNGADFIIWQRNLGASGGSVSGDADGDGDVDGTDFLIWQREVGAIADCQGYVRAFDLFRQFEQGKIVVSTLSDEDDGYYGLGELSIREALYIAAQNSGPDEIVFADNVRGTILLFSQLVVGSEVTIAGPGAGVLTIDAGGASRVFSVSAGVDATISGLTITGGSVTASSPGGNVGGGILNQGDLELNSVVVVGNHTDYANLSGANAGGGIQSVGGDLRIIDSTIDGNRARYGGGGSIAVNAGKALEISGSTISNNFALSSSNDGGGGGVYLYGASTTASLEITNVTFSGNRSQNAAAIYVGSATTNLTVVNATIADNHTKDAAGSYISGGIAAGINNFLAGTVTLHNTILADNVASNPAWHNGMGTLAGAGSSHNLIDIGYSGIGITHSPSTTGNQVGSGTRLATLLAPLSEYGGKTKTHALLTGSPAINSGSDSLDPDYDQRGRTRYGVADIGAVEYGLVVSTKFDESDGNYAFGDLSLREALSLAAATGAKQTIEFDPSVWDETISLLSGLGLGNLVISEDVEILGPGVNRLTIASGGTHRVFLVSASVTASISGVTITGGGGVGTGGGIYSEGNLTLDSVAIVGNHTVLNGSGANHGGGVYSYGGSLTIVDSTIDDNQARWGGGLLVALTGSSKLEIRGSTISNNRGLNQVSSGQPDGLGGGLLLGTYGTVTTAHTEIVNSTFSGNRSKEGAGISIRDSGVTATIVNSTIANNSTTYLNGGVPTLITGGYAGGIQLYAPSGAPTVTVHNSIVAANTASNTSYHDAWGAFQSASAGNLIGQVGSSGLVNGSNRNQVGTTSVRIDPLLGELADNDGPTKTHALLEGSRAIDAGSNDWANQFEFDQRGQSRFRDGNLDGLVVVDIGAYEAEADEFFGALGV